MEAAAVWAWVTVADSEGKGVEVMVAAEAVGGKGTAVVAGEVTVVGAVVLGVRMAMLGVRVKAVGV